MAKQSMTIFNYLRQKALGMSGLMTSNIDPHVRDARLTYVNNIYNITQEKIRAYNVWYGGDSDELLNYYTRAMAMDFNTDPIYQRNNKSYFWSVCSTEADIKRSHSGQPRNIVDTLVAIVGEPSVSVGSGDADSVLFEADKKLQKIIKDNNFHTVLKQKARPLTLVEGWGAWKINWDKDFSDTPILLYYRANSVDFFYRSNRLHAICYRDYYQDDKGHDYVLFEMRRRDGKNLVIEKELFQLSGGSNNTDEILIPCKLKDLPQLKDVEPRLVISNYSGFLGVPCIYFADNNEDCYGRSIFTGKLDLFDDLDQCYSQAANAVRRSTVIEYFDNAYLERDKEGMPLMPKAFDRKYIQFKGRPTGDGGAVGNPVFATQPQIQFAQYSQEEQNILINIVAGIMSPATLGIDIAKKDNAEAEREKEKVTIFTRNCIIAEEERIYCTLLNEAMCAQELMDTGEITNHEYDICVKYPEFADASFEAKLNTVLTGWESGIFSDEMAIKMLWGDTLDADSKKRELKFLEEQRKANQQMGMAPEDMGAFGELGADNAYNRAESEQSPAEYMGLDETQDGKLNTGGLDDIKMKTMEG